MIALPDVSVVSGFYTLESVFLLCVSILLLFHHIWKILIIEDWEMSMTAGDSYAKQYNCLTIPTILIEMLIIVVSLLPPVTSFGLCVVHLAICGIDISKCRKGMVFIETERIYSDSTLHSWRNFDIAKMILYVISASLAVYIVFLNPEYMNTVTN